MDSTLVLADGRTLAYTDVGTNDPGAPVVVYFHGAPTSRLDMVGADADLAAAGVRAISVDRPGYGGSSPNPGRSMADHIPDVTALLDRLAIDRFAVLGVSTGGPYAVAAAALCGGRVTKAAVVAGVSDFAWDGAWDDYEPTEATIMREPDEDAAVRVTEKLIGADGSGFFALEMPEFEVQAMSAMSDPGAGDAMFNSVIEAFKQGVDGYARDVWQQGRPWSWDVGAITAPVLVYHGDVDALCPPAHGRHTAEITGGRLTLWPGIGHVGAIWKLPEVLVDLLS